MKNYEKYAEEIRDCSDTNVDFCEKFIKPYILKSDACGDMTCDRCHMHQMVWLLEEYEEPETDWSKVKVDTPILVRDNEGQVWTRRYFAKYKDGAVYVWRDGCTSWSASDDDEVTCWKYAKLAESEKGGAK